MIRDYRNKVGATDTAIIVRSWPLELAIGTGRRNWSSELVNSAPMDPMKAKGNCDVLREQVALDAFACVNAVHADWQEGKKTWRDWISTLLLRRCRHVLSIATNDTRTCDRAHYSH